MRSSVSFIMGGVVVAGVLASLLGCSMPNLCASSQRDIERDARGGWAQVTTRRGEVIKGELLAVSPLGLYVLQVAAAKGQWIEPRAIFVKSREIRQAEVRGYERCTFWSVSGGALMYLNIWNIIVPIAMITTVLVANSELEKQSSASAYGEKRESLKRWARFPQGMPKGLDLDALIAPSSGTAARGAASS